MRSFNYLLFLLLMIFFQDCNDHKEPTSSQAVRHSLLVQDTTEINPASVKSDDYYDNFGSPTDTLIGCWDAIREGNITISFSADSTFEFYDYNSILKKEELLTGRFKLEGTILTLLYSDRPQQKFIFKTDPEANNAYRIYEFCRILFCKKSLLVEFIVAS